MCNSSNVIEQIIIYGPVEDSAIYLEINALKMRSVLLHIDTHILNSQ